MRNIVFSKKPQPGYPLIILATTLKEEEMRKAYLDPFGLDEDEVAAISLYTEPGKKKTPVGTMKEYVEGDLVPALNDCGAQYVIVTDAEYFKVLSGAKSAEPSLGYVLDSPYGSWKVVYVPNYRAIFYDPVKIKTKIEQGMRALIKHAEGTYSPPGENIIHFEAYPETYEEIRDWLQKLKGMNKPLAVDIEAFDLKHHRAGIGSITFCWSKHEGIAFPVDWQEIPGATEAPYGRNVRNEPVRALLRNFFETASLNMTYHHIAFDVYVLVYQLFMKNILDTKGLLHGMRVMLKDWDDTKLISYLATNSCAGNKLGLKDQAQEFSGNWAIENIKDITLIPKEKLLRYNLVDGLSTHYVKEKRYPQMVQDQQENIYRTLFKPATEDIIQMQLTGLPINMKRVKEVRKELEADEMAAMSSIQNSHIVQHFVQILNQKWVDKRNAELKKKRVSLLDAKEEFNPRSPLQLQELLYDVIGLPVLSLTKNKQPSTETDVLKDLKNHTTDPQVLEFLSALLDFRAVDIILRTFIPAMENAALGPDGWHYMFGNFNLGGTVSGRLSSSDPNLQNIPANSKYAKLIKSCVQAPPGWLFVGLDFASLEDRISALTTKDPNKLKVYTDGYDGHCLRAYAYFGNQMTGIDPSSVASINSIEVTYKKFRQDSKAPTFALTYQGTYITLMKNCGFSEEMAKQIEQRYKELYAVSIKWVSDRLNQATRDGYVTVAFGLRVRTPLLAQVIRGTSKTPYEAEAEGRTAGNAMGQSYCLLNNRAWSEFMCKVRASEFAEDIRLCAQIHDAGYVLVREDIRALNYVNTHLVKAVQWQDDPEIYHDQVKLGGEMSIFFPTWEHEITIPNGAQDDDIIQPVNAYLVKKEIYI